jgi:uncharacterized membrane protein
MAEFPASASPGAPGAAGAPPVSAALLAYALMGAAGVAGLVSSGVSFIAPLFGLLGIAAVIICHVKRGEAQGSWVAPHLRWMIRTFWFSLLWSCIGWLLVLTIVGIVIAVPLWLVVSLWILYRVLRGYLLFKDSKPVPGM